MIASRNDRSLGHPPLPLAPRLTELSRAVSAAHRDPDRTRLAMGASVTFHALVLAALVLAPHDRASQPPVTEITLLDPGDPAPAAPAATRAPSAAPEASPGAVRPAAQNERFRRDLARAEAAPVPQNDGALDDRLNARLAAIQSQASQPSAGVVASAPPSVWAAVPATAPGTGHGGGVSLSLKRGGGVGGSPLPLTRGGGGAAPALTPALAPAPAVTRRDEEPARGGEAAARRALAGATLMGPIADRAVLTHVTPVYPEWAKRDAVEASVTLYFVVQADGSVRENVVVQRTAGFGDFDENARAALRAWRFAPLGEGRVGEQWGTITFNFRLRGGG